MITLIAKKTKESWSRDITTIRKLDGTLKAIFPSHLTQPRRGTKEITINCNRYKLIWE
jgi:hypothetical protein